MSPQPKQSPVVQSYKKFDQPTMFVKYAFLAESAHLDNTGSVTAVRIFDVVIAPSFPAVRRDMTLVIQLEGAASEAGEHKISVELRDDKSNKLTALELPIAMHSSKLVHGIFRSGVIAELHDLIFKQPGHYEFVMFLNGNRFLGRITFTVQKIQARGTGVA